MNFSKEQIEIIAAWVAEGLTLSALQTRIAAEFGVKMTYMDVRFLVDDLDLTLVQKQADVPAEKTETPPGPAADETTEEPAEETNAAGTVSVSVDPVQRAGVLVGGNVVFSDGKSGQWMIDGQGRLGLDGFEQDYRPSPADVQEFQAILQRELAKLGY